MSTSAAPLYYPQTCTSRFHCERCGHSTLVVFHDSDSFGDKEPIGGRNRWMQEATLEKAQRTIEQKAAKALKLVRCPSCGAMSDRDLLRAYLRAAFPLCAVVPVMLPTLTIVLGAVLSLSRMQSAFWGLATTSFVALLVVLIGQRRIVADARNSVRFGAPIAIAKQPH